MAAEVELAPRVRLHTGPAGGTLVGGQPLRVLRLNPAAAQAVSRWRTGPSVVDGPAERRLAERLHALGVAVLRLRDAPFTAADVTVVVPVRDRPQALDRCLASLGRDAPVVVVDDASRDAAAVARVAAAHGARLVVRPVNGGPAAARNTGLAVARTPLVAFVDSDCEVPARWLDGLLPVVGADDVAAVAPRVVGSGGDGRRQRFETASGPLDLGPHAGPVHPGARVGHVPAAVLLCRRDALGDGFDTDLRVGEDVDLVWRLASRGRHVRYEPAVVVRHETRPDAASWWRQRAGYGRSAALLEARHPGRLAPAVVPRRLLPALVCLALRRPGAAAVCTGLAAVDLHARLPAGPGRGQEAARLAAEGLGWTVLGLSHAVARPWLPAVLPLAAVSRTARLVLGTAVGVRLWRHRRTRPADLDVASWAALRVADDLAYGSGLWAGALRERRPGAVRPRLS